ncbi:PpiC-type peptidyl-prolyl cis-trans isomerase [Nostoc linckia NIES-25]|nr:PpiC-type peptidyl-prolyl cis-trans isomerase [Nostoc linckia NIES-25]
MSQPLTISSEDILNQVKLSCKIPEIIEDIITLKIIKDAVDKAGIQVETEELQQTADQIRLAQKLNNADDTWAWLEKHSLSLDNFEELVYNTVISGKLAAHLFADKVEQYFFEHQLDYATVLLYEVILDDEDLSLELFYAIEEGEISFYEVAHKYIEDKELRRKLGYRGKLYRKDLKAEISAAVFAAKPPQLLKPIVSSKGIHLILVEEIIQPELDNKLSRQILTDLFTAWLKLQIEKFEFLPVISSEK